MVSDRFGEMSAVAEVRNYPPYIYTKAKAMKIKTEQ